MPKGISLHIGLNFVDPDHYSGWDGELLACEYDAKDMAALAKKQGFSSKLLLTKQATRSAVRKAILGAAQKLKTGDTYFLTYSGHGGSVPNTGSDLEPDGFDETWCLFDAQQLDDELAEMFEHFDDGVRIFVLSDSCHSGTVLRGAHFAALLMEPGRPRCMPRDYAIRVYMDHEAFYDGLQPRTARGPGGGTGVPKWGPANRRKKGQMRATALLISGCQDNQTSSDGDRNGLFTATMLAVWKNGLFAGDYRDFHKTIVKYMPPVQTPNFFTVGPQNLPFEQQKPFTI